MEPLDASFDNDGMTGITYDKVSRDPRFISRDLGSISQDTGSISRDPGSIICGPGPINQDTGSINLGPGFISRDPGLISQDTGSINRGPGSVKSYTMEKGNSLSDPRHGADPGEVERIYNTQGPGNQLNEHQGSVNITRAQRELLTVNNEGLGERCADLEDSFGRDTSGDLYCEREGMKIRILDSHLWMTFNEIQTEMIINRGGRFVE